MRKKKRISLAANQNSQNKQANNQKRGKTQSSKSGLILVLRLIGW